MPTTVLMRRSAPRSVATLVVIATASASISILITPKRWGWALIWAMALLRESVLTRWRSTKTWNPTKRGCNPWRRYPLEILG